MRQLVGVLLLLLTCLMPARSAGACSPVSWDFAKHFSVSQAVVHGRVAHVTDGGTKATLKVLAYAGAGAAPASIALPRTELLPGGVNCPTLQLTFNEATEYVIFLGALPPRLQFADKFRTALPVDEHSQVHDMSNHARGVAELLGDFASQHGYSVQAPKAGAPSWGATKAPPAWMVAGAGALFLLVILAARKAWPKRPG